MSHLRPSRRVASRRVSRVACRRWLQFERMEQRNLMAIYVVQAGATGGATGDGSPLNPFSTITQAVNVAKLNPGADEIQVGSGNYTESISITDPADLTIRGNAGLRPNINGSIGLSESNANFVLENLNVNSSSGIGVSISNGIVPNLPPNGPFKRQGSVALNNMNIQVAFNATFWDCVSVRGADRITANNLVLSNGRVILNDVNSANLSQITTIGSRSNALAANYVTQLNVNGWSAQQPAGTGIVITNPARVVTSGPPPVNVPSVVNLTSVQISGSGSSGLDAGVNTSLTILNSTFNQNTRNGMLLTGVTSVTATNVEASGNKNGEGISLNSTRGARFDGRNVKAVFNQTYGFYAPFSGSISIVGGDFSNNVTAGGLFSDNALGTIQLSDIVASNNNQVGVFLRNMSSNVTLTNVTTNSNKFAGTSVLLTNTPTVRPNVTVSGGQSNNNTQVGLGITSMGSVTVDGYQAKDNGGVGANVVSPSGTVSISNSQFNHNSQIPTPTGSVRPGAIFSGLTRGLTLNNITANDNPIDGIIVDNAVGSIIASGISASGNLVSGLFVNNGTLFRQASLTLTDSNLSNNGKNGLLANLQSAVTILRTHLDSNGPLADVDIGTGAWIASPGSGGILIEDTTAIGTRVGVQSGAGIQIVNTSGPEIQVRRVTISDTLVHKNTFTNFGAGLVVTGNASGLRVEDSSLNHNRLLDSTAARATLFSSVPVTVVRSQFLDNEGVTIDSTKTINIQDSTVARTKGIGVRTTSGGSIVRSTISGIAAEGVVLNSGNLSIEYSTLTGNATTARVSAPPFVIQNGGNLTLYNSIIAGNGPDSRAFSNSSLTTSIGNNLLSGTDLGWTGLPSDIIGDINNQIDPLLGPLTNNGGPTLTHMPLPGSPALENGSLGSNGFYDQRGVTRPQSLTGASNALPDIGAVEAAPISTAPIILVNSRVLSTNEGGLLSVRGRVSDIDGNLGSLVASKGSIQLNVDGTFEWTLAGVDDLDTSVTLTATDTLGGVGTTQFRAVVNNVAPTLIASHLISPLTRSIGVQAIVSDPGKADTFTLTIDWGDGTSESFPITAISQFFTHAYSTNWPNAIIVSVKDDDGGSSQPVILTVNADPTITLDASQVSVDEGNQLRMTGRVNDLDGNLSTLVASQGTVQLNTDGTFLWTLNGVDDLLTTVTLTATDSLGANSSATFSAEVKNVAPVLGAVTVTADWTTRILTLHASVTDRGLADTHLFTIVWDDFRTTTVAAAADGTVTATQQYFSGSGPVTIAVQAVDDDRAVSQIVTVAGNVLPTIKLDTPSALGNEGSQLILTGRATDSDGNLASLTTSLGAVQLNPDGTFTWNYLGVDDLNSTVTVTATDALGAATTTSFNVVVSNVAPTLGGRSVVVDSATNSVTLNTSVSDAGLVDTHLITIDWGDGTSSNIAPDALRKLSATHSYSSSGQKTITYFATDKDGGRSATASVLVSISPIIQVDSNPVVGNEGGLLLVKGRVVGFNESILSLTASFGQLLWNADGTFEWKYNGVDDLSRTIDLIAVDSFGAVGRTTFAAKVNNVAPSLGATSTSLSIATRTVTLNTSVIDVGLADTHLITIQWGDGTSSTLAPTANRTLTATHQYSVLGPTTITVKATDDDGRSSAVVSLAQTIPGFVIRSRELFVYGSSLADSISFGAPIRGQVTASANFGGTAVQYTFSSLAVDTVIGYLGAGNDVWSGGSLAESQVVYGESGNDQITTNEFDDILVGGDGADTLNGGDGRDLLFGGLGADLLFGQDGGDVLVAGRYERENDLAALRMLRTSWIGAGSYQTRVGRLRTGVGFDSQGSIIKLSISQITDDAIDQLFGGKDADWYLTNVASEVIGGTRDENIN